MPECFENCTKNTIFFVCTKEKIKIIFKSCINHFTIISRHILVVYILYAQQLIYIQKYVRNM